MTMQSTLGSVALAIVLAVSATAAVAQKPEDFEARIAAAKDLMSTMGAEQQFVVAIDTMITGMAATMKGRRADKSKEFGEVMGKVREKFLARQVEMIDMVAPLWAEKLTVAELAEIGAFYKTPTGRKLIAHQPEIMQKSMIVGMQWGQRIGAEVEAELIAELKKRGIEQ